MRSKAAMRRVRLESRHDEPHYESHEHWHQQSQIRATNVHLYQPKASYLTLYCASLRHLILPRLQHNIVQSVPPVDAGEECHSLKLVEIGCDEDELNPLVKTAGVESRWPSAFRPHCSPFFLAIGVRARRGGNGIGPITNLQRCTVTG